MTIRPAGKTRSPNTAKAGSKTGPKSAFGGLLNNLDLEALEMNLFRGTSPQVGWQRVFGGQVLGQALMAAVRTVEPERSAHSLHGYFLQAGDPKAPIIYQVERIRDGGSFTTRRVTGIQHGRAMFAMSISFQKQEDGWDHQSTMPDVPPPEDLPSERELARRFVEVLPEAMRDYWERDRPIELRPVDVGRYFERGQKTAEQHIWMRANGRLPDDPALHQCVLAYASDFTLLDTALIAHGKLMFDADLQLASLDHALWFHRPFRADDWLLYVQDSPSSSGGRGFCRGSIYRRDGALIASVTQEGLMRKRRPV
jgi:acyl-CoA thioesterase II